MNRGEIISKGFYKYPQIEGFVSVKQYMVLREEGKKYLVLRMINDRDEAVTGISLFVRQYDSNKVFIRTERVDAEVVNGEADSVFGLDCKIELHEDCADFYVDIASITFGSYKYLVRDGEVIPTFSLDTPKETFADKAEVLYKMRKSSQSISRRNHVSPKLFAVLSSIVFLAVCFFAIFQIVNFRRTETLFTLDNIKYSFETDNHIDGPICVEGYTGLAGNIIIPEEIEGHKVSRISKKAFAGSLALRSVEVKGETEIEALAFAKCLLLKSVKLEKVTSIGDYAFYSCSNLDNVELDGDIASIGTEAFSKCSELKNVVLPSTLVELEQCAFFGCISLESLEIPDGVLKIGEGIVAGCTRLKQLTIPYIGADIDTPQKINYIFSKDDKVYPPTKELLNLTLGQTNIVLPESFSGCSYIESIDFKKDVKSIGQSAFSNCKKLVMVEMTDELIYIGEKAFEGCSSLKKAYLSGNITEIKPYTFSGCKALVEVNISENLRGIDSFVFNNCSSLTVLKLPSTVGTIDENAFLGCSGLTDLTVPFLGVNESNPSGVKTWFGESDINLKSITVLRCKTLPDNAFKDCYNLQKVVLPDSTAGIGNSAFENCSSLGEFKMPLGVGSIGEKAFKGCSALNQLSISNKVTHIKESAFENCVSLSEVEIPDTVSNISAYAFAGCTSLKELGLPPGVTAISEGMLQNCVSLRCVNIPPILNTIGDKAFDGCEKLDGILLPESTSSLGEYSFRGCSSLKEMAIPSDINSVGQGAFAGCSSLSTLKMPHLKKNDIEYAVLSYFFEDLGYSDSVPASLVSVELTDTDNIPPHAFADCTNVQTILLPQNMKNIGAFAFKNCKSLKSLTIPRNVSGIAQNVFVGCTALEELSVPFVMQGSERLGGLSFWFDNVPKSLKRVTITDSIQIPQYSFYGCTYLKEVVFDCAITSISDKAFYYCSGLRSIVLPRTLAYVGNNAFEGCYRLYEVTNNSVFNFDKNDSTFVCNYALSFCEFGQKAQKMYVDDFEFLRTDDNKLYLIGYNGNDSHLILPNNPNDMGSYRLADYIFYKNEEIESVCIPSGITSFGKAMFSYCYNLKEVTFSKDTEATYIPQEAFASCVSLERIDLPSEIKNISPRAFEDCNNLIQIWLPSSLEFIGENAFFGCTGMLEVINKSNLTIKEGTSSWGGIAQYAIRVGASRSNMELYTVHDETAEFRFANISGKRYLYRIDTIEDRVDVLELPDSNQAGVSQYAIIKNALLVDCYKFIIPTCVVSFANSSLEKICSQYTTVYYFGNEAIWLDIVRDCDATVYYYADDIAFDNQWTYDSNGKVETWAKAEV